MSPQSRNVLNQPPEPDRQLGDTPALGAAFLPLNRTLSFCVERSDFIIDKAVMLRYKYRYTVYLYGWLLNILPQYF